jgi:hypothetical protein
MVRKGYTPAQIINKLHEAEALLSQRNTVGAVCKKIVVSDYTCYRWRKECSSGRNTIRYDRIVLADIGHQPLKLF